MQIEGRNPVREALQSGQKLSKIYIAKGAHDLQTLVDTAREKEIPLRFCDRRELDRMSESGRHQGVIAIGESFRYTPLDEVLQQAEQSGKPLFLLLLDGIEDPHNLGSILRVAECCGANAVVIPARRSVSVTPTVLKVSAGAAMHIPVVSVGNLNDTIRTLCDRFVRVLYADMQGTCAAQCDMTGDLAIVIGSEGEGVKFLTRKLCDGAVSIPQYGKVNSLNASVACGMLCYEWMRQRPDAPKPRD